MFKLAMKLAGVLILVLAAFALGANQHRMRSWPFHQGPAKNNLFSDGHKDRRQEIALWIENLKKGGYILYFRHASREKWPEVTAFDVYEFATRTKDASGASFKRAVCLSEQGIEEAKLIGRIFQLAKIPTGIIVSSPSCRAKQTAIYAFGKYDYVDSSIRFPDARIEKPSPEAADPLLTLLQTVEIKPASNTIISGHQVDLERYEARGLVVEASARTAAELLETGFYVIERRSRNKLAVVFSFKSISDLTNSYTGTVVGGG